MQYGQWFHQVAVIFLHFCTIDSQLPFADSWIPPFSLSSAKTAPSFSWWHYGEATGMLQPSMRPFPHPPQTLNIYRDFEEATGMLQPSMRPFPHLPQTLNIYRDFEVPVPVSVPVHVDTAVQPRKMSYLDHPTVKQLIKELHGRTERYNRPNEGYDIVLRLLRSYFTRHSSTQQLYDGTKILPYVLPTKHDELAPNLRITGLLFENDIALTVPQVSTINNENGIQKRKIIADPSAYWPRGIIPYRFGNTDESWRQQILETLRYWEAETCLKFNEDYNSRDFLYFDIGSGCYSGIGRLGGGQMLSIGYGCETLGIISHELGHAIGFWHEQERPDRDNYVRVDLWNVVRGIEGNFKKRHPSQLIDLGVPYDLGSVMHYSANSFAINSSAITIYPLNEAYLSTIGNRIAPSFTDFKQINLLYCSDRCQNVKLNCQNGGYPDPNNCAVCKCPDGLGGNTCEHLKYSTCGKVLQAGTLWQTLNYSGSSNCFWKITAPNGGHIIFEVIDVHFKCDPSCEEYVEVKHKIDLQVTGFRLCCLPVKSEQRTEGSSLIIITRASRPSHFALRYSSDRVCPVVTQPLPLAKGDIIDRNSQATNCPYMKPLNIRKCNCPENAICNCPQNGIPSYSHLANSNPLYRYANSPKQYSSHQQAPNGYTGFTPRQYRQWRRLRRRLRSMKL